MQNPNQNDQIKDLLDLLTSRIHRRRQQSRVPGTDGGRTIDELIDETGIGPDNETDNLIINNLHILDCGHPAKAGLGGRCHYCDSLLCKDCVFICSACGHSICNLHCVKANFDGENKPYCRDCAEEIGRSLRMRAAGKTIISFFLEEEKKGGDRS